MEKINQNALKPYDNPAHPDVQQQLQDMDEKTKAFKIWDMRVKGHPLKLIGKIFDIGVKEVKDYCNRAGDIYREEIMDLEGIDFVASNIQWLDEMERIALNEAHSLPSDSFEQQNPVTGEMEVKTIPNPDRAKFFDSALEARKMKLQLLKETGVIPQGSPENLFKKLKTLTDSDADEEEERSSEEISQSIKHLMKHGRFMKSGSETNTQLEAKEQKKLGDNNAKS